MRRNRILILLAVLVATSTAVFWLSNVLAAATIVVNEGLTVEEAGTSIITETLLLAEDPDAPGVVLTYTLVTTPANGSLLLNGTTTLTPTGQFNQSDIDNGFLAYAHDDSETLSDSFDFTAATSATTTAQTTFNITITPDYDQTPMVNDQIFSVDENSPASTPVDTVVATDLDAGDSLTYTITGGNFGTPFSLEGSSGDITVNSTAPLDYETNQSLTVTVQVEDLGALTDTAVITVNVNDVNEAPTVIPETFTVNENSPNSTAVGTPVMATDQDAGDTLTYSITDGDLDTVFAIGSTSGQITVADNSFLNFEAQGATPHYSLTVQASDGALTGTAVISVNILDVNEAPNINPTTRTVNENSDNGTDVGGPIPATDPDMDSLTYSITDGDPDEVFDIVPTSGQITVADNSFLNFEALGAPPHFSLTIQVSDGLLTDTAVIVVNVNDRNEEPTVIANSFSIDENSANGTSVGTVVATDPDAADLNNLTFGFSSGNTGNAFAIDDNGLLTVANTNQLDYETTQSFMLGIIVTDTGGLQGTANVTVNINNLFDESPTVNNATLFVSEGSTNGAVVGTVTATDPELASGDALTFSITGGNTGSVFAINSSSGQITVLDASKLDADTMPTFNLTVRAIDKGGQIDTGIITINVSALPITYIFLPSVVNNYPPIEPNNNCTQAYGIGSGTDYTFIADDQEDWYAITLNSASNLTAIVSSFEPSDGQLIMYGGTCTPSGDQLILFGNNGDPTTTKTLNVGNRPAGTYFIRVYSVPATNTSYTLRVNIN